MKKKFILRGIILPLTILMIIVLCYFFFFREYTPKITGSSSVSSLEYITIGGEKHFFLIRGEDQSKPILLFVHGGPGMPSIPLEHASRELEKDFIVVHYDQRGGGKSDPSGIIPATINDYDSDLEETIHMLLTRFDKDKLYLVGHSWGTILGLRAAQNIPELLYAYIGVGQYINGIEQEQHSYDYVVKQATLLNNSDCLDDMAKIKPPYFDDEGVLIMEDLSLERKWLGKMGGVWFNYHEFGNSSMMMTMLRCTEYKLIDFLNIEKRAKAATVYTWPEEMAINFIEQVPQINIPIYFFIGRSDYNTPFELSYDYYMNLDAPKGKHYIWFDRSGHVPYLEEPVKFREELLKVLAETHG